MIKLQTIVKQKMNKKEARERRKLKRQREELRRKRELKIKRRNFWRMAGFLFVILVVLIAGALLGNKHDKKEAIRVAKEIEEKSTLSTFDYGGAIEGLTLYDRNEHNISKERADELIQDYAAQIGVDEKIYNTRIRELLMNHFEARDFVFNYPLYYETASTTDALEFPEIDYKTKVPQLYQWDMRWGYKKYGSDAMGLTGCGPTALSMVVMYLLKDKKYTPDYIADFALEQGYAVEGSGTSWSIMSEGAAELGVYSIDVNIDEDEMATQLIEGRPLICIMGAGHFTNNGHFIVISGYEPGDTTDGVYSNGKFIINDPNCMENTEKKWTFEELQPEIQGIWGYLPPE